MFAWLKKLFNTLSEPALEKPVARAASPKKTIKSATTGRKTSTKKKTITKTELNRMTKDQLKSYALSEHKVEIDKRRKKSDLVAQVLNISKSD